MWNQQAPRKNEDVPPMPASKSAVQGSPEEDRRKIAWVGKSVVFKGELTSAEDMTLGEVAKIMMDNKVSGLPVIGKEGTVIGIITESDIFRMIVQAWQED